MIKRIDHVAIAVRDLEKARSFFVGVLGGRELFSMPFDLQKFRWTTIELGTSCFIELIDPLEEDGFVHRFLEKRGEGPHHVTIQVEDIHTMRRILVEKGVPIFGFSESLPGWKEFFINPKHAFGTLIQFAEFDPLDWLTPGYVPAAYRELVPTQELGAAGDAPIEARRIEGERGPEVEIRQAGTAIRLPEDRARDLIRELEKCLEGPDPSP